LYRCATLTPGCSACSITSCPLRHYHHVCRRPRRGQFEAALKPYTTFIYLESPNSWTFELQDIKAVAALAKKHNIITLMDNSYCTPLFQKPIPMGIDLCMQTATKYIGGHSDTLGGVLTGSQSRHETHVRQRVPEYRQRHFAVQCLAAAARPAVLAGAAGAHFKNNSCGYGQFLKTHPKVEKVLSQWTKAFRNTARQKANERRLRLVDDHP
jgi:selenocysteine lyase/cysteine desulfurase